jgi:hypothetical protein
MKRIVMLVGMIFLLTFITANNFGYNYLDQGEQVIEGANYSINVNNTDNFGGYSVTGLYNYYKGLLDTAYDLVYCKLTGCTMSGDIDMGGNDIVNAGNVTANYFKGDGSELTGISGMNYTNLALTNQTNTFNQNQTFTGNVTITGTRNQLLPNLWVCQKTTTSNPIITSNLTKSIDTGDC